MNIDFKNDEILFLEGETGIVGIVKVAYENKNVVYCYTGQRRDSSIFRIR